MKQQNQTLYVEQDAERMIRMASIRRTLPKARFLQVLYGLSILIGSFGPFLYVRVFTIEDPVSLDLGVIHILLFTLLVFLVRNPMLQAMKEYREAFLRVYVPSVLRTEFTELEARQDRCVPCQTVQTFGMMNPGQFLDEKSLFRVGYRGIPFEQSEMEVYVYVYEKPKGGKARHVPRTIFQGRWTNISLFSDYRFVLQIVQNGFRDTYCGLPIVRRYEADCVYTQSTDFNRGFQVYASNESDALSILTPDVMERIQNLAAHTKGRLMLCFVDGDLHIVAQGPLAGFQPPNAFLPFRDEQANAYVLREIALTSQLIDALLDNKTLFPPTDAASYSFGATEQPK